MGIQAYSQPPTSGMPSVPAYPQPVRINQATANPPVNDWAPPASSDAVPSDQWRPESNTASPSSPQSDEGVDPFDPSTATHHKTKQPDTEKGGGRFLKPLEPGQEIPKELRDNLNPLQHTGVWMIENMYQRVALKQKLWGYMRNQGVDVCLYSRRARQQGIKSWESCSQFTKMAIVRDGFFIGCARGAVRMLSCNPILFALKTPWSERYIERHSRVIMPESHAADSQYAASPQRQEETWSVGKRYSDAA